MSAALFDSVTRIARHEAARRAVAGIGVVTDVFPADTAPPDHAVSVRMLDSGLVLPNLPVAVGVMGFASIPAIDDLVVVLFTGGDIAGGVVVGRLYHPGQVPPKHASGEIVLALPSAADDPKVKLVAKGDEPSLALDVSGDVSIRITDGKIVVAAAEMTITLDATGSGLAEIAAGGSKLSMAKDGDITISSAGKLKLEGQEIEISGSAKVKIDGATVEIN